MRPLTALRQRVLDALREHQPIAARPLAEELGISDQQAHHQLGHLELAGYAVRAFAESGRARYVWSATDKQEVRR